MKEQTMNLMNDELDETMLEDVNGGRCGFFTGLYDGQIDNEEKGWGLFYWTGRAISTWSRKNMEKAVNKLLG